MEGFTISGRLSFFLLGMAATTVLGVGNAIAQPSVLDPTVTQIAAGFQHTCALTTAGGVRCWGDNRRGQLGDGTTMERTAPGAEVTALASGVVSIVAGLDRTCALTMQGGVKCWGYNYVGALGDGTEIDRREPVDVSGLTHGVVAISAGSIHTCALTIGGGVKCWGGNYEGRLGDGTTINRSTPVDVVGLTSGVASISAGQFHACALTFGGGIKCWGSNVLGQLGDGTLGDRLTPVDVNGLTSGAASVAGGLYHTCALTTTGGVKCWGRNNGTATVEYAPVSVPGAASGMVRVATGWIHSCALNTAGQVKCWGSNDEGELGDGTTTTRSAAEVVAGLPSGNINLSVGPYRSCVVTKGGGASCWGLNAHGQLGDGTLVDRHTPIHVAGLAAGVANLSSASYHVCAVTTGHGAKCWGRNDYGQLGDGTFTNRASPVDVLGLGSGVARVVAGIFHSCALTTAGGVKCWGLNHLGQLGDGTVTPHTTPAFVNGLTSGVIALSAGQYHNCALMSGGAVKCWGVNSNGELGDGTKTMRTTPVSVLTGGVAMAAISLGAAHTCALIEGGGVQCWGSNFDGEVGDGSGALERLTPVNVSGLTSGVAAIGTGKYHSCAVTTSGEARCWGRNQHGQVGDGTTESRFTSVTVSGLSSGAAMVGGGGEFHTCALNSAGGASCWGWNGQGQLGDGGFTNRPSPVPVSGLSANIASLTGGFTHTCSLDTAGEASCWGSNAWSQLGDGTSIGHGLPVPVRPGQTIDFDPPGSLVFGAATPLVATASSGLAVTFDSWTPETCAVTGNTVIASGTALCGIRASQAGAVNQAHAPQVLHLLRVLALPPTVTTPLSDALAPNRAVVGGTVTLDGGSPITQRGVVYAPTGTNSNPQIGGSGVIQLTSNGTVGTFSLNATGLTPLAGYSFKAYATNGIGTSYTPTATFTTPARASRVFVSGAGNDSHACASQITPCRNLAEAIDQVATDGEVIVLTADEYETALLVITKGVRVTAPAGVVAFIRQPIVINAPGGWVALRGLTLKRGDGAGEAIGVAAADTVSLEGITVDGWSTGLTIGSGLTTKVSVADSIFRANSIGILGQFMAPAGRIAVANSRFEAGVYGLASSGGHATIRDSAFVGFLSGISASQDAVIEVHGCELLRNSVGAATSSGATIRISRSLVFGNDTGLDASAGGALASYGNNVVRGNGTNTTGSIGAVPER